MRKLFLKILVLIALVAGTIIGIMVISFKYADPKGYLAAVRDKHELLAQAPSPKLIFVGGSNIALGFDSQKVQRELHMPTVNMGLHAGVGLRFMLNEIKPYLSKGDVVVIVPEYDFFFRKELLNGEATLIELLSVYPQGYRYVDNREQYFGFLKNFQIYFGKQLLKFVYFITRTHYATVYQRDGFDQYGDFIAYLNKPPVEIPGKDLFMPKQLEIIPEAVNALNDLYAYAKNRGATVLFIYPCIPDVKYDNSIQQIRIIKGYLARNLKIPILGEPEDYIFPFHDFYDSTYHLDAVARPIRTDRIIRSLKAYFSSRLP